MIIPSRACSRSSRRLRWQPICLAPVAPGGARVREPLRGHPARDDAVNQPPDLAMQACVQLKTLAQSHFLGESNHQMAVVPVG